MVTNGPLVEIEVDAAKTTATAHASFFRPLQRLDIIVNGVVAATVAGDGTRTADDSVHAAAGWRELLGSGARCRAQSAG